jgi:hypothetical protein
MYQELNVKIKQKFLFINIMEIKINYGTYNKQNDFILFIIFTEII